MGVGGRLPLLKRGTFWSWQLYAPLFAACIAKQCNYIDHLYKSTHHEARSTSCQTKAPLFVVVVVVVVVFASSDRSFQRAIVRW